MMYANFQIPYSSYLSCQLCVSISTCPLDSQRTVRYDISVNDDVLE